MLFIVDMQNDFVDQINGKMPVKDSDKLVPDIRNKVKEYENNNDLIFYTINIHKNMPDDQRPARQKQWGQSIYDGLNDILFPHNSIEKMNYGLPPNKADALFKYIEDKDISTIEILGVETHICVLSNAIILQNIFPNSKILINEDLCISNDIKLHKQALTIMKGLQMEVKKNEIR